MSQADKRHAEAEKLLQRLRIEHEVLKHFRPLDEESVEASLTAAHPGEEAWLLRLALHRHLNSDPYLQSLSRGGPRCGLDGEPVGEVDSETRHHAHNLLKHHRVHQSKR
jgi:hypothetical protein